MSLRSLLPFAYSLGVLLLLPFAEHGLAELQRFRAPRSIDCIGDVDARLRIVYLHGRDTYGPSWVELKNRDALRALATSLDARIALPRARGGWPLGNEAALAKTQTIIGAAARQCFHDPTSFGVIGFSDGANVTNELFLQCRSTAALWFVSVGGDGAVRPDQLKGAAGCARIAVVAGQHEPTYMGSKHFARQLAKRGVDARFFEHDGVHDLPFAPLYESVRSLSQ
jgi:hypothetical protein